MSLENIEFFSKKISNLLEVSIGHALICESLYLGLENVIPMYLGKIKKWNYFLVILLAMVVKI